jgi:hypothetical protein
MIASHLSNAVLVPWLGVLVWFSELRDGRALQMLAARAHFARACHRAAMSSECTSVSMPLSMLSHSFGLNDSYIMPLVCALPLPRVQEPIMGKGLIPADPETWKVRATSIAIARAPRITHRVACHTMLSQLVSPHRRRRQTPCAPQLSGAVSSGARVLVAFI